MRTRVFPLSDAPPPETPSLRLEILDKMTGFMTAALGLVAALAWNSAIQAAFATVFQTDSAVAPMFVYAVIVTIVAVLVIVYLGRATGRARERLAPRRRVT